jgi:N-methylhydantoinase B
VYIHWYTGGGGLGDPIDRAPAAVLADIGEGLVSEEAARASFGVLVSSDAQGRRVDSEGTAAERASIRRARLGGREARPLQPPATGPRLAGGLLVVGVGANAEVACRHCGQSLGPATANFKERMAMTEVPGTEAWPRTRGLAGASRFVLRRFHCPGCATQLEAEVSLAGRPPIRTVEVLAEAAP